MFIDDKYVCCGIRYVDKKACLCLCYGINCIGSRYIGFRSRDSGVDGGICVSLWAVRVCVVQKLELEFGGSIRIPIKPKFICDCGVDVFVILD